MKLMNPDPVPEIALPTPAKTWLEQRTLYNKEAWFPEAASVSVDKTFC